jgi:hypothetical protein
MYPNLDFWFENIPSGNPGCNVDFQDVEKADSAYFLDQGARYFLVKHTVTVKNITNDHKSVPTKGR